MTFNFLNPQLAVDAGFVEGDYRVVDAYFAHQSWARKDGTYKNQPVQDSTVLFLELKNLNSDPHAEPHRELYIVGNKDIYIPSMDGATPLPQSPRRTSQDIIPVSERASVFIAGPPLYRHTAAFTFLNELGMCGFPMDKIYEVGVKALIGVEGHMRAEGKQKEPGTIEKPKMPGDREERLTPVFKKILRSPWDSGVAVQTQAAAPAPAPAPPVATAAPAPAPTPAPTADKATTKSATKHLLAVLSEDATAADTAIEDKLDLKRLLTKRLVNKEVDPAERNAIFALVNQPGFFNDTAAASAADIGATYTMKEDGDIKRVK